MREPLKYHPIADVFPLTEGDEFDELVCDVKNRGLRHPIILFEGMILDGRNRQRACEKAGRAPRYEEFKGTTEEAERLVISENINRRHLKPDERRHCLKVLLHMDWQLSDRALGKLAKVDHKTVAAARAEAEANGEIPHKEANGRREKNGRQARGRRPGIPQAKPAKAEPIEQPLEEPSPEPVNIEPAAAPASAEAQAAAPIGSDEWVEAHAQWLANNLEDRERIWDVCGRAAKIWDEMHPGFWGPDDDDDPPPKPRKPAKVEETTIGGAVNDAFAEWRSLAEEIREVVDNSEAFSATQRIQTLDETAGVLEGLEEPKVEEELRSIKVSFPVYKLTSRAARNGFATCALEACIEAIADNPSEAAKDLREELQNAVSEAECCEFPGMYG
jgi:ParB-like chromosome segregation protein Spo0J